MKETTIGLRMEYVNFVRLALIALSTAADNTSNRFVKYNLCCVKTHSE
jgi:hypothetical protein